MIKLKAYLDGKEYNGSVYFFCGTSKDNYEGYLSAFHYNNGTCLEFLKDENGGYIVMKEHAGKSGYLRNGELSF